MVKIREFRVNRCFHAHTSLGYTGCGYLVSMSCAMGYVGVVGNVSLAAVSVYVGNVGNRIVDRSECTTAYVPIVYCNYHIHGQSAVGNRLKSIHINTIHTTVAISESHAMCTYTLVYTCARAYNHTLHTCIVHIQETMAMLRIILIWFVWWRVFDPIPGGTVQRGTD